MFKLKTINAALLNRARVDPREFIIRSVHGKESIIIHKETNLETYYEHSIGVIINGERLRFWAYVSNLKQHDSSSEKDLKENTRIWSELREKDLI
jgi:hypothetical protein